jgi:beta-glucanase (GH16 family)
MTKGDSTRAAHSRRSLFLATIGGVLALGATSFWLVRPTESASASETIDLSGRKIIFADEFDRLSVSAHGSDTTWSAHTPWNGDFGDARFADPTPDFPFTVKDGILRIEMRHNKDGSWESGLLSSSTGYGKGFTTTFGYFDMRARLPAGDGLWPAFWLNELPPPDAKTKAIEIDIIEHYGRAPGAYNSTVTNRYLVDKDATTWKAHTHDVPKGSLYDSFHTYGADVTPQWVIVYFDRREIWRTPTPPGPYHGFEILVDFGLGSGWPIDKAPQRSVMEVDYVRVYAPKAPVQTK